MVTQADLYRFTEQGSSLVWTYTSADEEVVYDAGFAPGAEAYAPTSISRSGIEVKNDMARANIDVQLPLDDPGAVRWLQNNGELLVGLTIFERDKAGTVRVIWKGRMVATVPGMTDITLRFESIFTSLRRPGLRARFQRSCRHALYRRGCNLDAEDFATLGSCTAASGTTVTVSTADGQPNGYYVGGMLRSPDGVLSYIIGHNGEQLTLQRLSYSLASAIDSGFPFDVTIYPGCDHALETCWNKFNNGLNCGCFRWIPQKNPVGGSSIV